MDKCVQEHSKNYTPIPKAMRWQKQNRPGVPIVNNRTEVKLETEIECPECGYKTTVTMPEDACVYFWECPDCGSIVRPQKGDCCVFCSYGTVSCPPVQRGESC